GVIGYSDSPSVLQTTAYIVYLLIAGGIFAWITRKPGGGKPVKSVEADATTLPGRA
ncbi:MAG: hypothetical protein IMW89_22140, partial [Ktedonobacteraceae bacterium]|nr:hypothetical protein [Ktedonobacteraceae bacterium]